jgi:pseudouridine-5'-phosphate glycosidase
MTTPSDLGPMPAVALESTVISHGLPYPQNLALARDMEAIVRKHGAEPRTVGVISGEIVAGLDDAQVEHLATAKGVRKVSRRDLPIVVARKLDGATTVATTMWIAHRAGIHVFATGGIGGVHRTFDGNGVSADISADLQELAQTPVIVVCAGAKAILDLDATLEYLETYGVTVAGLGTDEFPAFYSRSSGLSLDIRCDSAQEIAELWRAKQQLGLPGGLLVTAPIPEQDEIPAPEIEPFIEQAVAEAGELGLRSAEVTPYLLARIVELSGERSLRANVALLKNNARVAAEIAVALG